MPMYSARCQACGSQHSYFSSIANRANTPQCCGTATEKTLDAPAISAMAWTGHAGFHMPDGKEGGYGTWIEDGAAYKRYLKQHNVIPESEGVQEATYQRKQKEQADEKRLDEAVTKAVLTHTRA